MVVNGTPDSTRLGMRDRPELVVGMCCHQVERGVPADHRRSPSASTIREIPPQPMRARRSGPSVLYGVVLQNIEIHRVVILCSCWARMNLDTVKRRGSNAVLIFTSRSINFVHPHPGVFCLSYPSGLATIEKNLQ